MNEKWDKRFLDLAEHIAGWSKDPSTQCGAVITEGKRIVSLGFNGFPVDTDDSREIYNNRKRKYKRVLHAEQNALLFARENLTGYTCYVFPMPPCSTCAAMLIQAGIARVVSIEPEADKKFRWAEHWTEAEAMFKESGVEVMNLLRDV